MANDPQTGRYTGPETLTLTLKAPIKSANGEIAAITLREPDAGALANALDEEQRTNNVFKGHTMLIALCSGLNPAEAAKLKKRDFEEARDFLLGFTDLPPAAPTGPES